MTPPTFALETTTVTSEYMDRIRESVMAALADTRFIAHEWSHDPETWLALRQAEEALSTSARHLGEARRKARHCEQRQEL